MKSNKSYLLVVLCLLMLFVYKNSGNEKRSSREMYFGKTLTIAISENETIDADYLQRVLSGEVKRDSPFFDLWDTQEFIKLIDYMDKNDLILVPGEYTFNQSWKFDDGFLVLNSNEKREVFQFEQKDN